ncbi:MAG: MBL fold metallo-hydrolase [Pseudomonadota bacterium]
MSNAVPVDHSGRTPIRMLVAANPSPMTGDGTNCFVIGAEALAVIDPGPADPAHLEAIVAEVAGRPVFGVFVTHSHLDHSPGAGPLAERLGAPVLGFGDHAAGRSDTMRTLAEEAGAAAGLGGGEGADWSFKPDETLADGAAHMAPGGAWRLVALHTPGHTSNHLSFALEEAEGGDRAETEAGVWRSRALFCGDHVMAWSTSIVSPPDGDMGAYMASLAKLAAREDPLYLPAHGPAIADPRARLEELTTHRRGREAAVLSALEQAPETAAGLAKAIYTDLDPRLLPLAERNVLAHLIDLWEQGRCAPEGGQIRADARFRVG